MTPFIKKISSVRLCATRWLLTLAALGMVFLGAQAQKAERTLKVTGRYLNFPVSQRTARAWLSFSAKGVDNLKVAARLAEDTPDYWVFKDMDAYRGKTLTLTYGGSQKALDAVVMADTIVGQAMMYREAKRPQFHFTTRRGWINDPNGLIYHDGRYHLYYQHNPFEREWGDMTWGHAYSTDLIHWTEAAPVLHPDTLGTMFSGSAVYDAANTSGLGSRKHPPLVYAYTIDSHIETQGIAYSLDGGFTLTKYAGNPVIDSHEKWQTRDTRAPRLFWYDPGKHWVMVLNERDGHSIYTSANLLQWEYQSHVRGFWECPDLFELPVDGNSAQRKWVMYGASGTYMLGSFDGRTFRPEGGKHAFATGSIYAAQTFNGIPASDGRRIQIGWGRIAHPGMPFNGMMLLPTELRLVTTPDGVRLTSFPVAEVRQLCHPLYRHAERQTADQANDAVRALGKPDGLHVRATLHWSYATGGGISLGGKNLLDYDANMNTVSNRFYSPRDWADMQLTADIYVDRTSVEVFLDDGLFSYSFARDVNESDDGLAFWGAELEVSNLTVESVDSVW